MAEVTLDTTGRGGQFSASAFVHVAGQAGPIILTLKGIVHPEPAAPILALPERLVFNGADVTEGAAKRIAVIARGSGGRVGSIVAQGPPWARANLISTEEVGDGAIYQEYAVSIDGTNVAAPADRPILFSVSAGDSREPRAAAVLLVVEPGGLVKVTPPTGILFATDQGSATFDLHPRSAHDRILDVAVIEQDGDVELRGRNVAFGRGQRVSVPAHYEPAEPLHTFTFVSTLQSGKRDVVAARLIVLSR